MIQSYMPVAGDVLQLDTGDGMPLTVASVATIGTTRKALGTIANHSETRMLDLSMGHVLSSASGAALFSTAAGGGNTGTGAINSGTIVNGNAWIADTYTVTFTSTTAYTIKNSANATIVTGTYSNPTTIAFLGVTVTISGAPVANDTFTLTAAAP